jgi:hypothetical protein
MMLMQETRLRAALASARNCLQLILSPLPQPFGQTDHADAAYLSRQHPSLEIWTQLRRRPLSSWRSGIIPRDNADADSRWRPHRLLFLYL